MRRLGLLCLAALVAVGCVASDVAARAQLAGRTPAARSASLDGGEGVVSAIGKVGRLTLGLATEATVERFAGRPDLTRVGTFNAPKTPRFKALAYDCSRHRSWAFALVPRRRHRAYCRTVYFINNKTGHLGAFYTSSPRFHTRYGTHPGSSQKYANAHEDAAAWTGCAGAGLDRSTSDAILRLDSHGGKPHIKTIDGVGHTTSITGGTVGDFELEQATAIDSSAVGLQFCS